MTSNPPNLSGLNIAYSFIPFIYLYFFLWPMRLRPMYVMLNCLVMAMQPSSSLLPYGVCSLTGDCFHSSSEYTVWGATCEGQQPILHGPACMIIQFGSKFVRVWIWGIRSRHIYFAKLYIYMRKWFNKFWAYLVKYGRSFWQHKCVNE